MSKTVKIGNKLIGDEQPVFVVAEIGINQNMGFIAASVNKIPILAAVYYFANQGEIDLDQKITIQASDIQDYGTGIIRYEQPGVIYSLKTLARLMMEKSDNTAAYVLTHRVIGQNELQEMVEAWGLTGTNVKTNDILKTLGDLFLIKKIVYFTFIYHFDFTCLSVF